ncbi:hypothetical protein M9H77_03088 [Catharanthus roseus]|uniref:Uncharacterized protein n=1 Tax=Catharanthus roseus TaxID=4058 RepID=A0ACC0CA95_CATRO|nr:hypothetical protein M9H77_03088 [Catharanthus roseus]
MGNTSTNSSWQMMEAIGRQEMAYSKLARTRSNCYKDGDYNRNAYGKSHHRDGHYTHRSQMGIGNFSFRATTFDHIPYDNCCENSPYDVHKGCHVFQEKVREMSAQKKRRGTKLPSCEFMGQRVHSLILNVPYQIGNLYRNHCLVVNDLSHDGFSMVSYKVVPWILYDSLGNVQHTLSLLENNYYGFDESLISFISDLSDKFQGEFIEKCAFLLPPLGPYVLGFVNYFLVDKPLLLANGLFENSCQWPKFLIVEGSFKMLLQDVFSFKFFHLHYKEPFKEVWHLWNSFGVEKMFDKLHALFSFSLLILESFGNVHNIASFNSSMSNVGRLLWLFEGMDSRMNPSKERGYGMTQDKHENMEIFQGPITKSIDRKIEEKNKGMVILFKKNFRDLTWNATEGENEGQRRTKTFLMSKMQAERAKGTSLEDLEDSTSNGEEGMNPTAGGRPLAQNIED